MAAQSSSFTEGLEGIVAAQSSICTVDGQAGRLIYFGYDIHDLAGGATFEEVCYLLWHGRLPARAELGDLQTQLAAARVLPDPVLRFLKQLPKSDGMDVLRTATSLLAHYDKDAADNSPAANYRKAVRLTAQLGSLVATYGRFQAGQNAIDPHPALGHAGNFLYMLTGNRPDELATRAFDIALMLHADHELNASTFAARETAAALSDVHSAVVSGIGALKGPLHGGANEQVMLMVEKIKDPAKADAWIHKALTDKARIMGFGHRVYRVEDPRAKHLKRLALELGQQVGDTSKVQILDTVVRVVGAEKHIFPNVDLYSGAAYAAMGISTDQFTPIFAMSRIAGWTAHVLEQHGNNRLIRPRSDYTGAIDLKYVPLSER